MEIEDNEQEILLEQENVSVGGGAVNSVNGQVGDVVLTTSDLENTSDYQTGSEVESAISTAVATETTNREAADTALQTAITNEATARANADTNLQSQIDGITASSDVTDIVGTYAQLQAYDTSTLGDNDIIKVLQDESRNNETTYYRWSTSTQSFTLIGEEGPYYTKSQTDTLLNAKQNVLTAGNGINIANDEISGVDFVGTDGTAAGEAGLVPAPATTDAGKFLKADGTWDDAGGSGVTELTSADYNWPTDNPTSVALWLLPSGVYTAASGTVIRANSSSTIGDVAQGCFVVGYGSASTEIIRLYAGEGNPRVYLTATSNGAAMTLAGYKGGNIITEGNLAQSTGTSTTDVMSQNAVTSMVFNDPSTQRHIKIGSGASLSLAANGAVAIGRNSKSRGDTVSIGYGAGSTDANRSENVNIGHSANCGSDNSVALGYYAKTTRNGEVNIGSGNNPFGYDNTNYRVLGGVHDPVDDHDAATKGYVDTAVAGAGGGGGVKILTADDYNWNSTTNTAVEPFDSVALWLLDSGIYMRTDSSVVTYRYINGGQMLVDEVYILGSNAAIRPIVYYTYADTGSGRERAGFVEFVYSSVSTLSGQLYKTITIAAPVNNLTSTATNFPLSANQGKVLNDKITALEARVAALEGN